MYTEEEREADQHVVRYRWLRSDLPQVHPPFYALACCPKCGYTDFKEDFFDPAKAREGRASLLAPRLKTELARRGSAVAALRLGHRPGTLDFSAALRLHLLAIITQELMPEERRDHLRLARLYLRAAWLYREQGESSSAAAVTDQPRLTALDACAGALRELTGATERLTSIVGNTPAAGPVAEFARQVAGLGQRYLDLRGRLQEPPAGSVTDRAPLDFLLKLRGDWPAVPTTEAACLDAAIRAFERVYQEGDGDTLGLLKLMIELNYRVGRGDRVLEYAASMTKSGQEERLRLQRQLDTDRTLAPPDRSKLTARINRLTATLQLAAEIRREALSRQPTRAA